MSEIRRDEHLGAALRELRVPEHGPGFWERLEVALEAEAPKRPPPRRRPRLPRRRSLRLGLAAAVSASVAIGAAVIGLPRTDTPEPALAEVVKERVAEAIGQLRTLEGQAVLRSRLDPIVAETHRFRRTDRKRFRFTFAADGSFRVADQSYDATAGVERAVTTSASLGEGVSPRFYIERRGLPSGPPDGPKPFLIERELGTAVRALLDADDPRIEESTYRGRPAWHAVFREPLEHTRDTERIEVTIDRETGLPVQVRRSTHPHPRRQASSELHLFDLEVNGGLPADAFTIEFPRGAEVNRGDVGFRRVELDDAAGVVGYEPLVPATVPEGFELSEVAVARRAPRTSGQRNPVSRGVIAVSYRRGFERLTVTTRLVGEAAGRWRDPFGTRVGEPRERLSLSDGSLDGARAELVVGPRSIPHLWALGEDLVLTVAGDLSRDELARVAESLQPH